MNKHYAEYEPLFARWIASYDACDHPHQHFAIKDPEGRKHTQCSECNDLSQPLAKRVHAAYKIARKAELAAMPRCMVDGCKRRGLWTTLGATLLCGQHWTATKRAYGKSMSGAGGFGLLIAPSFDRTDILEMASTKP